MIRSYTVTFAFVTFRVFADWLHDWMPASADQIVDDVDTMMAWACWAVPLLVAEPLIQLRAMRKPARQRVA